MTFLGFLSALTAVIAIAFGGVPREFGFRLSANFATREVFFTPIIMFQMPNWNTATVWRGLTIGGTSLVLASRDSDLWRYEIEHVPLWEHFGVSYPLYAFVEPCNYDPLARWSACENRWQRLINPYSLLPTTAAFVIHF